MGLLAIAARQAKGYRKSMKDHAALLARRQALAEEIARHPRPITGCDVHFNRLLEERAALSEEIDRLENPQAPRTKPTISSP